MGRGDQRVARRRRGVIPSSGKSGGPPQGIDPWLALLAGAGFLLSVYLVATKALHAPVYCPVGSGCDVVQSSRFGAVFGIPVSVFGVFFYGVVALLALRRFTAAGRWSLLFPLASAGVAASVVFTGVQQLALRVTCSLCVLSAILSLGIVLLVIFRRPQAGAPRVWLGSGAAALAVVVFLTAGYASSAPQPAATGYAEGLARHLSRSGVRLYGAYWCPHCKDQKELFGPAARALPYIECDPRDPAGRPAVCTAAGIRAYPTWDIGGKRYEGVLSLEELARLTGYSPPGGTQ